MLLTLYNNASKTILSSKATTGLLVGVIFPKGYTAIAAIPTPADTNSPSKGAIDYGWCAEHAHQVARMLPGGLSVIGMFGPTPKDLARMLLAAVSVLPKDPIAVTTETDPTAFVYPAKTRVQIETRPEEAPVQTFKCVVPKDFIEKTPVLWVVDGRWTSFESAGVPASSLEPGVHAVTLYSDEQIAYKPGCSAVCGAFSTVPPDTPLGEAVKGLLSDAKKSMSTRKEVVREEEENREPNEGKPAAPLEVERVLLCGEHNLVFTDYKTQEETLEDVTDRAECILGLKGIKVSQVEKHQRAQEQKEGPKDPGAKAASKKTNVLFVLLPAVVCVVGILLYALLASN